MTVGTRLAMASGSKGFTALVGRWPPTARFPCRLRLASCSVPTYRWWMIG
jgi:hypothetical protein